MNKEEQELRYKIRKIVNRPWRSPSIEEDELMALLPPRQEVMSEEEIKNIIIANHIYVDGQADTQSFVTIPLEALTKALSGRIARPEPQKNIKMIDKIKKSELSSSLSISSDKNTEQAILVIGNKVNEVIDIINAINIRLYNPEPQKPTEYCQCKPEERILCRAMECGICHKCNLEIPRGRLKDYI